MTERPILFSAPMVCALIAGTKTQTRRLVRYPSCPFGAAGDTLWVRETWASVPRASGGERYLVDEAVRYRATWEKTHAGPWRPSIYMPRWASRLELVLERVGVERLNDITEADAQAEGITPAAGDGGSYVAAFARLWDELNGKRAPWQSNPWVWALGFRVVTL